MRGMRDWLQSLGITHVAMESTGVFWKPIYNLLEEPALSLPKGHFELLLVNAQHIKAVPGRKTDVKDAEWIADLLQHGLLRPSFIPPAPQREVRELTRYRTSLIEERSRTINRLHKTLEDTNIKVASVVADLFGVSGRRMLAALIAGERNPQVLANLAVRRLQRKLPELLVGLEVACLLGLEGGARVFIPGLA